MKRKRYTDEQIENIRKVLSGETDDTRKAAI